MLQPPINYTYKWRV